MFGDTVTQPTYPIFTSAAATDTGRLRPTNQDAFVDRGNVGLWAVADGMGGHRDGDVASRMVCEALAAYQPLTGLESAVDDLRRRMNEVNARLHAAAMRDWDPVLSGSTVVIMVAAEGECAILWAGDSRAYRLRAGRMEQLTSDHTWVAELHLDPADGETSHHAITRAVGGDEILQLDMRREHVEPGDRYLLCSDGLTRELSAAHIARLLGEGDARECAQTLIEAALTAGGRDNVTVVVIDAH